MQIDEILSYIKKKEKNVTDDDSDECGDVEIIINVPSAGSVNIIPRL